MKVRLAGATVPSVVSLADQADRHIGGRLAVEHDVKVAVPPASVVAGPGRADCDARGVVVGVGDGHVGGVQAAVAGVGAGRRGGDDRVGDVAVVEGVVDAGDGDGLRRVPVGGVKVRLAGATVPSVVSLEDRPMVTSAVGWVLSTTVKVAVPPASVVTRPPSA